MQECLSGYPKIKILKIEALESRLAGRDVLAILQTGFKKSLIDQVFCLAKRFVWVSDFTAEQHHRKTSHCISIDEACYRPFFLL